MLDLTNKTVLITGGTGSFGKRFVELVLKKFPEIRKLIVYSRDEMKQYEMAKTLGRPVQYVLGDVRDRDRLVNITVGVDVIIHAAALKQVPAAEANPIECIKTNITGAENVIEAAFYNKVPKVIALSTDKAASPSNLYGATKLCAEKLFIAANNFSSERGVIFSVVRFGNVIGSRGSVLPFFLERKKTGVLPVTDKDMTRFNVSHDDVVDFVLEVLSTGKGGEIFIPKLPSFKIVDLATAVGSECKIEYTGIRPGEKIHEDLITEADTASAYEFKNHYVILPPYDIPWNREEWAKKTGAKKIPSGFRYSSDINDSWLNVEDLRRLIEEFLDQPVKAVKY